MPRKTITINDEIFRAIQGIRASFLRDENAPLDDISFTTAVNMILFGGIVGKEDFSKKTWGIIRSFVMGEAEALERVSLKDKEYEGIMRKLFG